MIVVNILSNVPLSLNELINVLNLKPHHKTTAVYIAYIYIYALLIDDQWIAMFW